MCFCSLFVPFADVPNGVVSDEVTKQSWLFRSLFAPQWRVWGKQASVVCEWIAIRYVLWVQFAHNTGEVLYFWVQFAHNTGEVLYFWAQFAHNTGVVLYF